jgi:hypothetical protein
MGNIKREQKVVEQMIRLYCRHKEGNKELCEECTELLRYAQMRLTRCPFGDKKSACKTCSIHCYSPQRRAQIKAVMRYSGPRMLIYHPITAILHLLKD